MKKLIYIAVLILFASCNTPYSTVNYAVDLSQYSKQGFQMTTAAPLQHTPVAIIENVCTNGTIDASEVAKISSDPSKKAEVMYANMRYCSPQSAIDNLHKQALKLNANGIYHLAFTRTNNGLVVSGLAVKIE